jgi:RNA polymerase sigma factor (sigma-70 family)
MIRDQHPEHWEECYKFVQKCVYAHAKNLPHELLDDIVQEIMFKITKYLPHFRFQCALKTWLNSIIKNHIIDEYRKQRNQEPHLFFSTNQSDEDSAESLEPNASETDSTEDTFELLEKIRMVIEALQEYANTHSNSTRNKLIIQMVFFEGRTYEDAAKAAGCSAPVVGYVVREAQIYVRGKWSKYLRTF